MQQGCRPQVAEPPTSIMLANMLQPTLTRINVPRISERGPTMPSPLSTVYAMSNSDVSPQNPTHRIIPSEDPQCAMEIDDDEDDGVGDGIGEGANEGDDERDPANGDLPSPDKPLPSRRPLLPGFSEPSKPELLSASSEMCKVDRHSMQFARHFGSSGNPLPSSLRVVSPRQHHCTTLASFCGIQRHGIRTYRALSAVGSCNAMMLYLDPDDVST